MLILVVCLVLLIIQVEGDEGPIKNPEIRIDYTNNTNENFTVFIDKPLKIIIEKGYVRYVWCSNKYAKRIGTDGDNFKTEFESLFVPLTECNNDSVTILNINKVTAEMSTRWMCTVLQEYHGPPLYKLYNRNYTAKDLYFHLHVRGARSVKLTANHRSLTYVTTNLSVNYDGDANYTYEFGENVEFSCVKFYDSVDSETCLEYYDSKGVLLFQTKPRLKQPHTFRSVLKLKDNKNYFDCIRITKDPLRKYRYRTTLYMKTRHVQAESMQRAMVLTINGQNLTTFTMSDPSSDGYIFKYIDGELLNVTCRKANKNIKGTLNFYFEKQMNDYLAPALGNPETKIFLLNVSTLQLNNKTLGCGIKNTDVPKPNANILLMSDIPAYGVRIRGLPRRNILYQYTKDRLGQWTTEYQYSPNEIVNLTCVSKDGLRNPKMWRSLEQNLFLWKFKGQIVASPAVKTSLISNINFSNKTFTKILDATHNGAKIQCVYSSENRSTNTTAVIILRLKPGLSLDDEVEFTPDEDSRMPLIITLVSVAVSLVIMTMVCIAYWRKRTKQSNLIQNAYDSLSNQNDSSIPAFPHQWEVNYDDSHYSKIEDEEVVQDNVNYSIGNEKLFRMPYERHSNISENHYTEIDEYFKPKPDGLATNLDKTYAQPTKYNKEKDRQGTASHSSNNIRDAKQNAYDKLRHNNLPKDLNLSNKYNGIVQIKSNKNKSVTFGPNMNSNLRNKDRKLKQKRDGHYANSEPTVYMQPGDLRKKPNYENHYLQNNKTDNQIDLDYAEPYSEVGISCENEFYG